MKNNKTLDNGLNFKVKHIIAVLCFAVFAVNVCAQTAMVTNNFVYYPDDTAITDVNYQCVLGTPFPSSTEFPANRSFSSITVGGAPLDPWVNSALIEFDNVFIKTGNSYPYYPNHCLSLCAEVTCSNPARKIESSNSSGTATVINTIASGDFPIQTILFDVFKYQANANPYNPDDTPPIRTIAMYPAQNSGVDNICHGVDVYCPSGNDCEENPNAKESCCDNIDWGCRGCNWLNAKVRCDGYPDECKWDGPVVGGSCIPKSGGQDPNCTSYNSSRELCESYNGCIFNIPTTESPESSSICPNTARKFDSKAACEAGLTYLHFCTPWDGSYEIDGEFGKTNGQFGYRTTIKTNYPGDGISVTSNLNIEHMIVYPGDTQIPMQVDVTNVHSVRSSPTLVGSSPAVITSPYRIRYRLSKDATTTINIIDPVQVTGGTNTIHRHLVSGQPRDGEGMQGGAQTDILITNEDSWDGRDDEGRLLPYGNYLVSIQAQSFDEWSGTSAPGDISRAVTRQLSLDPLKITDIAVSGLGHESTSYAMISYMLTEAATVHFEIYTPGTSFGDLNIGSAAYPYQGQAAPTPTNGLRVASYTEQKARRVTVNNKWDGMCWDQTNCGTTQSTSTTGGTTQTGYAYGGAMPDGDYVYLLWAEIPYGSSAGSAPGIIQYSSTTTVNNIIWDGVKTHMIYNGIIPINRGYPEITIDAVSYSTIGSSPIANGLDPFVITYSLSRDSYVDAGIYTTASSDTYTSGVCETNPNNSSDTKCAPFKVKTISEGEVKEALTRNMYNWNGLDDEGRYVSAGVYMLQITAKDALFPAKMVTRTIQFPVDMFRVVDVNTTPLTTLGSSNPLSGMATINYMLSKSMGVEVRIYDRGVIIPTGGECAWPPASCAPGLSDISCCIHYSTETPGSYSTTTAPIKTFKGTRQGEGYSVKEFWDGYKESNIEMVPDGIYPYVIIASAPVGGAEYYRYSTNTLVVYPQNGKWHSTDTILATDRPTGYITIGRDLVYFTNIEIKPTHPKQYYSSQTVELAPYEIDFTVNRLSTVTVEIWDPIGGMCMNGTYGTRTLCRTITRTNFIGGGLANYNVYDGYVNNQLFWDGKDENGYYVKNSNYQVVFTAEPYLNNNQIDTGLNKTVEVRDLMVRNFQVFDRYIWDVAKQNNEQGKFAYQISVPMKTAIQIFKPDTMLDPVNGRSSGTLINPIYLSTSPLPTDAIVYGTNTAAVLVKTIVGVRPNLVSLDEIWDGTDYAGQKVPDGIYKYRFVTVQSNYEMNSITGDPIVKYSTQPLSDIVMDWNSYINLDTIQVANGDSWYGNIDWKDPKVTMFYPNPMKKNQSGFFEITKVPAPGTVSIKIYNIAGDLVRDRNFNCVNAIGTWTDLETINANGGISPDWNGYDINGRPYTTQSSTTLLGSNAIGRNFALRCEWNKQNNAGNNVARGLYYAIMTLNPTRGNSKKSQRVIKILIP